MGISGLSTALGPLKKQHWIGCSHTECPKHRSFVENANTKISKSPRIATLFIIDGPSLVYRIYSQCLARGLATGAVSILDAQPSYAEAARDFVQYLEKFERNYGKIYAIHFDGGLPVFKRQVRVERLNNSVKSLRSTRNIAPEGIALRLSRKRVPAAAKDKSQEATRNAGLPAPSFMVAAVVEALRKNHHWRNRLQIVPGEADPYIAADARQAMAGHVKIVLSDDSDFAAHSLGDALLCKFESLTERACACGKGKVLRANCFNQAAYFKSKYGTEVGLAEAHDHWVLLLYKACKMNGKIVTSDLTPKISIPTLTTTAEGTPEVQIATKREEFVKEHAATVDLRAVAEMPDWQKNMDNRPSELAQQFRTFGSSDSSVDMYLPSLIEDPERTSGWTPSRELRAFAYAIMANRLGATQNQPSEFVRSGIKTFPSIIPLTNLTGEMIAAQLLALRADFTNMLYKARSVYLLDYRSNNGQPVGIGPREWIIYAVAKAYDWYVVNGKVPPSLAEIRSILGKPKSKYKNPHQLTLSWSGIHFWAIMQCFLYSLRLLRQALTIPANDGQDASVIGWTFAELNSLPPLVLLMLQPREMPFHCAIRHERLGAFLPVPRDVPPAGKGTNEANAESRKSKKPVDPRNLFSVLSGD